MATAEELLATVGNEQDYIVIDSDLRTMTFPASVKNIGVENDKDVHKLNFMMPRYFSDYDLSTFNIRINYVNANGDGDMYVVTEPTVEDDAIYFSWLVGRHACLYKGAVTFIVCLKLADGEGDVAQEFNTTLASLQVLPGLETEPTILETDYDIIEQLLLTIQDTNDKIKAVLDSGLTPEEITDFVTESKTLSARMDTFTKLPSGSTTGDAELADIRVGADGTVYSNAGEAVRTQVNDVKRDLSELNTNYFTNNIWYKSNSVIVTGTGNYVEKSVDITPSDLSSVSKIYAEVGETIGATANAPFRIEMFQDSTLKKRVSIFSTGGSLFETIPTGTNKILLSFYPAQGTPLPSGIAEFKNVLVLKNSDERIDELKDIVVIKKLDTLSEELDDFKDATIAKTETKNLLSGEFINGRFNVDTGEAYTQNVNIGQAITLDFIPVEPDEKYSLSGSNDFAGRATLTIFEYDANKNFLQRHTNFIRSKDYTDVGVYYIITTSSNNVAYVRLAYGNNDVDYHTFVPQNPQFEKGVIATSYVKNLGIANNLIDANAQYNKLVKDGTINDDFLIPDYWKEHIKERADYINSAMKNCAANGDAFIFITDEHWRSNQKHSPALLKYIHDHCFIDKLFDGGDNADGGVIYGGGIEDYKNQLYKAFKGKVYSTPGNHEFFNRTSNNEISYYYNMYQDSDYKGNAENHYFYVDNERVKIRYIFLSSFYESEVGNQFNGFATDPMQREWLRDTALNIGSDWIAIVVSHMFYYLDGSANPLPIYYDARSAETIRILEDSGKVACIIQGHTHIDRITQTPNLGIPVVITTCDKNAVTNMGTEENPNYDIITDRPTGTTEEQAFDVVIVDRTLGKMKFVRVGAKAQDGVGDNLGNLVTEREITMAVH